MQTNYIQFTYFYLAYEICNDKHNIMNDQDKKCKYKLVNAIIRVMYNLTERSVVGFAIFITINLIKLEDKSIPNINITSLSFDQRTI